MIIRNTRRADDGHYTAVIIRSYAKFIIDDISGINPLSEEEFNNRKEFAVICIYIKKEMMNEYDFLYKKLSIYQSNCIKYIE